MAAVICNTGRENRDVSANTLDWKGEARMKVKSNVKAGRDSWGA